MVRHIETVRQSRLALRFHKAVQTHDNVLLTSRYYFCCCTCDRYGLLQNMAVRRSDIEWLSSHACSGISRVLYDGTTGSSRWVTTGGGLEGAKKVIVDVDQNVPPGTSSCFLIRMG